MASMRKTALLSLFPAVLGSQDVTKASVYSNIDPGSLCPKPKIDYDWEVPLCLEGLEASFDSSYGFGLEVSSWNSRLVKLKPLAVVRPKNETEVQRAVRCAAKFTTVSVRSGGHSYEGYWRGNMNGVVVDLRNMHNVTVDTQKKQVTVQAGALMGQIIAELWEKDQGVLPHGLQSNVGVGGLTLGGGFGLLSRNYGLMTDRVVSMKMVTAKGELITVSKDTNSDLFFALRGSGGGSFGVVTEFTFSYIKHAQDFTVVRYNWEATQANYTDIVYRIMQYYNSNPPKGASHYLNLSPGGSIELGINYSDDIKQHHDHIRSLNATLVPCTKFATAKLGWIDAYHYFAGYAGQPATGNLTTLRETAPISNKLFYKAKSGFLTKTLSNDTIDALRGKLVSKAEGLFVLIDLLGGEILKTTNTAFANRHKFAMVQIGATDDSAAQLLEDVYAKMEASFDGAYVNYMDADEDMAAYHRGTELQLSNAKSKYDPNNTFCFARSIPLLKNLNNFKIENQGTA